MKMMMKTVTTGKKKNRIKSGATSLPGPLVLPAPSNAPPQNFPRQSIPIVGLGSQIGGSLHANPGLYGPMLGTSMYPGSHAFGSAGGIHTHTHTHTHITSLPGQAQVPSVQLHTNHAGAHNPAALVNAGIQSSMGAVGFGQPSGGMGDAKFDSAMHHVQRPNSTVGVVGGIGVAGAIGQVANSASIATSHQTPVDADPQKTHEETEKQDNERRERVRKRKRVMEELHSDYLKTFPHPQHRDFEAYKVQFTTFRDAWEKLHRYYLFQSGLPPTADVEMYKNKMATHTLLLEQQMRDSQTQYGQFVAERAARVSPPEDHLLWRQLIYRDEQNMAKEAEESIQRVQVQMRQLQSPHSARECALRMIGTIPLHVLHQIATDGGATLKVLSNHPGISPQELQEFAQLIRANSHNLAQLAQLGQQQAQQMSQPTH